MVRVTRAWVWPFVLLALLLQVDAVVKSTVMTAVPVAAMPMCDGSMAGMASAAAAPGSRRSDKHPPACPYCAAAVQPPLAASPPALPVCGQVAFAGYRVLAGRGPRGPPARRPRARDPPPLA